MAYSEDAVTAKLSALNETQDSIVSVAQWIMFHRRHADRTASIWLQRLQDSPVPKRLNLIYLANEVVQQSRARGKSDFMLAFEPLVADATAAAYKHASQEVQGKIKRVVEVWRQRNIFDARIMEATEGRILELDKSRGGGGRIGGEGGKRLGGSLFGGGGTGGVPGELDFVAKNQVALSKAEAGVAGPTRTAEADFAKMIDPNAPVPTPPVHAARLSSLARTLATAQTAVDASMKARRELLAGLENLIESNRAKLAAEEQQAQDLQIQRDGVETKKKEVEDAIMRGLSAPTSPSIATAGGDFSNPNGSNEQDANGSAEPAGPEPESFTPPPPDVEAFTPPAGEPDELNDDEDAYGIGEPGSREHLIAGTTGAENVIEQPPNPDAEPAPSFEPPPALQPQSDAAAKANDFLNSLITPHQMQTAGASAGGSQTRSASGEMPADPRLKRRKLSHKNNDGDIDDEFFGPGAVGGVDEDGIAAMLGQ
ncbi:DUF618-domain-containing protein [Polychaeton citri CBS 116435]|uniref:DUF618-domain-containing protein n=1 Tax=Polychaeton citri CBS 116435 TaxID=1314669 RepID=A0A9P4QGP1_9PEZI|nr:DUF618-domain-containing protein [Polychaeton citri CBS 116435]